jgi:long-chain acyl-CoA synthetase
MAAYLGEKLAPEHLKELTERVCPQFSSFYGMSECLGLGGTVIRSEECVEKGKWGSVGRPNLNSDLRIAADLRPADDATGSNVIGEVVVRSPSFADGNWGDPGWRDRVLTPDGWYRSGDLGYIDEDGYLFLSGRVDNVISTGGIKVAAEEIEQIIETHPDVANVVVLGLPDGRWGERIGAAIVPRTDMLTVEDLERWCESDGRLARFKWPKEWRLFRDLPLNSANKRDRRAVAELWAEAS